MDEKATKAEPPLLYDAKAISSQYRYRPWQVIGRALVIIWSLGSFAFRLQLDKWLGKTEINRPKRARELRKILTKLGPTFIKVGQALSTRPDLIRRDFLNELIELQDRLPPFDNQTAFEIIESELGHKVRDIYREISPIR